MKYIVKCKYCNKEIGVADFKTFSINFKGYDSSGKIKLFCNEACYNKYTKQFEVEVYNGNPIYVVEYNGEIRYMPYWFSNYYFTNIEDCKRRIDLKNIAIVPNALL